MNKAFDRELKNYIPRKECLRLYTDVILEMYNEQTDVLQNEKRPLVASIKGYYGRLFRARGLLAKEEIDSIDFWDMKSEYKAIIEKLEAKLTTINNEILDVEGLLNDGISRLLILNNIGSFGSSKEDI